MLLQYPVLKYCLFQYAFEARNWNIPQFHGKWPFIRLMGVQEPASVVFSALNFYVHYKMLQEFRAEVRPDSPLFKLWHAFSIVSELLFDETIN